MQKNASLTQEKKARNVRNRRLVTCPLKREKCRGGWRAEEAEKPHVEAIEARQKARAPPAEQQLSKDARPGHPL